MWVLLALNGFSYESYGTRTMAYTSFFHEDYLRFYVGGIGAGSVVFCLMYIFFLATMGNVGDFWAVLSFFLMAMALFSGLTFMILRVARTDRVDMRIHSDAPMFFDLEKWSAICKLTWVELLVTFFITASMLSMFPSKITEVELSGMTSEWSYQILYLIFAVLDTLSRFFGFIRVRSYHFNLCLIFFLRISADLFTLLRCYSDISFLKSDAFGLFQSGYQGLAMGYSYNMIVYLHQQKMETEMKSLKEFSGIVFSFMTNLGLTVGSIIQVFL
jgi:hypothetical protein